MLQKLVSPTEYFSVTISAKQDRCFSAYYLVILAEILTIELRNEPKIKGVVINEIMKILGQYADNVDLYMYHW